MAWWDRYRWLRDLELDAPEKLTLQQIFSYGCVHCGFTWTSAATLAAKTGLGERRLRSALANLVKMGYVRPCGYERGGRGMATQYVVAPHVEPLPPAPCADCSRRMKKSARGAGFVDNLGKTENPARGAGYRPEKPARGAGYRENPADSDTKTLHVVPQNPARGAPQEVTSEGSNEVATLRDAESSATPRLPAREGRPPLTPEQLTAEAERQRAALELHLATAPTPEDNADA